MKIERNLIWGFLLVMVIGSSPIKANNEELGEKLATPVPGPEVVIEKEVLATSGGTVTGGPYTMSYTLGQPSVVGISRYSATMKKYDLQHGFWQMWCINNGDVIGDGYLTAGDAQSSFYYVVAFERPNHEQWCAADCNGDGQITAGDAQGIFYAAVGLGSCSSPLRDIETGHHNLVARLNAAEVSALNEQGVVWLEQEADRITGDVTVKIMIANRDQRIDAYTLDLSYDPAVYAYSSWSRGELDPGWEMIDVGVLTPGLLRSLAFCVTSSVQENETGSIMEVVFTRLKDLASQPREISIERTFDDLKYFVIE